MPVSLLLGVIAGNDGMSADSGWIGRMKSLDEGPCPASLFFRHIGEPVLERDAEWFVGRAAGIELVEFFEEIEARLHHTLRNHLRLSGGYAQRSSTTVTRAPRGIRRATSACRGRIRPRVQ